MDRIAPKEIQMFAVARTVDPPLKARAIARIAIFALNALVAFGAAHPPKTLAASGTSPISWHTGTATCTVDYNRATNTLLVSPPSATTSYGPNWYGTVEGWTQLVWRARGSSTWVSWGSPIYHGKTTISGWGAATFPGAAISRPWTIGSTPGDASAIQYLQFVPNGGTASGTNWQLLSGATMNTYYRGSAFPTVTYPNPNWYCTFP
jgi:hypothetical protein